MRSTPLSAEALEALRKIPPDKLLPPDAPERFVDQFVDALDLDALGFVERRRPNERDPHLVGTLLKLVLFAAVVRIIGQRPLAEMCKRDVGLLFLCNFDPPGKSTIWRFWRDHHRVLPRVFDMLVRHAAEGGLVGMDLHALDGTKIRAASSMHTAVHREGEQKKLKQLTRELERLEDKLSALSVQELRFLQERAEEERQKTVERVALLDTHGTDHVHPNEPDARVMRCDPRPLLAYNGQAVVDHESDLIVAIGLSAEENDQQQLVPMMEGTKRVLGAVAKMTDVDAGYTSGPQLHAAHERHLPVLGPVQPEWDKGLLPKSSFAYNEERDVVVCPRGEELPLEDRRKMSRDAPCETAIYRCHKSDCPERAGCTSDRKGRTVKRTPFDDDLDRHRALLAQPEMRNLYDLRKEIVEHVFGCIKGNDNFRRFTVRGLAKAFAQWALACIALDLRKVYVDWAAGLFSWPPRALAHA
jgi:transposase